MLKNELIARVSELESELKSSQDRFWRVIRDASDVIFWKDRSNFMNNNNKKIQNMNELFFEIWKLVQFKESVLEGRGYLRQKELEDSELNYLKNKLEELEKNYERTTQA